ncbi:MAG: hypothetical protein IPP69_06250 [Flavobacteriales bacterium]|nr:hypothetical protein [Flavobacteriales bacterium]
MIKKILLFATAATITTACFSQRGMLDNALGVRVGLGSGVTYQHFFSDRNVFEGIAYQRFGGVNVTALYEIHQQMFDIRGLKWYLGAGGHAWLYNKNSVLNEMRMIENSYALGVDGILGMAFYLRSYPLQFSVDWKPGFNLKGSNYIEWDAGAMSVRYRF